MNIRGDGPEMDRFAALVSFLTGAQQEDGCDSHIHLIQVWPMLDLDIKVHSISIANKLVQYGAINVVNSTNAHMKLSTYSVPYCTSLFACAILSTIYCQILITFIYQSIHPSTPCLFI